MLDVVECHWNVSAGYRNHGIGIEAQDRPAHGDFQACGIGRIAQQRIAQAQRTAVHRTGRRHADSPVAEPSGEVLHGGLGAGCKHLEGGGLVSQPFQAAGPGIAFGKGCIGEDLTQVVAVGLDAIEQGVGQRLIERSVGRFTGRRMGDELGDHRVEVGRNLAASLDPGVDAQSLAI